eukprot:TRINITY_DN2255_c0_g1_i6.p1 TRINITY_DN2255_c0_g1~~TRINITY_DN2255_c0_g1_i6.p1  ORF type:complete len:932 (+),score=310.08 TRINITY_DN2255_c0_g1_i6:82-2877(+)
MRAFACAGLCFALVGAQGGQEPDPVDDRLYVEHEYMNKKLGITGDQHGTIAKESDDIVTSTIKLERSVGATAGGGDEWSYVKAHIGYFTVPVSASLSVCSLDDSECYTYEKWSGDKKLFDPQQNEDGGNRFSTMSIDGHSVKLVLRAKASEWNDATHGVVVRKLEKGRHTPPEPPAGVPGRAAGKLSICGQNERLDAVCHKRNYPEEFKRSYNVARLYLGHAGGVCTAWRVSAGNLMMTNNHCFDAQWQLSSAELHFNYQKTVCGGSRADAGTVKVSPETLLRTSKPLDYTIFTLTRSGFDTIRRWRGSGGETFGYFTLEPRQPRLGERIYIPQHGAGDPKQISITDDQDGGLCKIKNIDKWGDNTLLGYSCDTVGGSSGSPVVLGANHRVIGLHNKGGCPTYTNGGIQIQYIWPEIQQFFDGAPPPAPVPAPPPVSIKADCQGYWGRCKSDCTRSFYVTTSARNGGACPPNSAYATREPCDHGTDDCKKACVGSCSGRNCGDDGCGKSCGSCYAGYECMSGQCTRVTPVPAPAPVSVPTCGSKPCKYVISNDGDCPSGYEVIGSPVTGCATAEDECEYGFAEAIRARGSGDRPREYEPPKPASSPWWSTVPARCYVEQFSNGEYVFFNQEYSGRATATRQKAVCRKKYFRGPGCQMDKPGAVCTPNCWGKECGDDGCGGQCNPGCDVSAGEKCSSAGKCVAPTCGSFASLCAKPGYKLGDSSKTCSKSWSGSWCSVSECCVRRYCSADAYCDSGHDMVPSASTAVCEECDGSTRTVNPKSCCFPKTFDPVDPPCPADKYSAGFCSYVVQASAKYYNKYRYCNDPDGPYTVHCKTSCKNAGYNVCGQELMSAVSLAAGQGGSSSDLGMPAVAGIAVGTCLLGLFAGLLIAKVRSGGSGELADLGQTTSSQMSPTQRLDDIQHRKLASDAQI